MMSNADPTKSRGEPRCSRRVAVPASYKVPVMLLIYLLCANKHKSYNNITNRWGQRRTEHCFYAEIIADITNRNKEHRDT